MLVARQPKGQAQQIPHGRGLRAVELGRVRLDTLVQVWVDHDVEVDDAVFGALALGAGRRLGRGFGRHVAILLASWRVRQ